MPRMFRLSPYIFSFFLWIVLFVLFFIGLTYGPFVDFFYPSTFIAFFIALNFSTFFLFGFDKIQSFSLGLRVPEKTLYVATFLGGSVGALFGMYVFRHKTRKTSFQVVVALLILIQIFFLVFFVLNGRKNLF